MENQVVTSVILVSFNTGSVLDKSIASVLQTTLPIELILVNNGNPPDVERKLKAMAEVEPRLKILSGHGNIGYAKAANLGAKNAVGKFLLFLQSDALLPKEAFERLYAIEAKLKPPFMLGAKLVNRHGAEQKDSRKVLLTPLSILIAALRLGRFFPKIQTSFDNVPLPAKISLVPAINGAFIFIHTESFWNLTGFDENYFLFMEDVDFCKRFSESGGSIYFVPSFAVLHEAGDHEKYTQELSRHKAESLAHYMHSNFSHIHPQPILWCIDFVLMAPHWLKRAKDRFMEYSGLSKRISGV